MILLKKSKLQKIIENLIVFSKAQFSAFVGGITDYLFMILFTEVFHMHYTISIVIGGIIGAVVNFSINKRWTFRSNENGYENSMSQQLLKFIFVVLNSIFLKSSGTYLITTFFRLDYKISRIIIDLFVSIAFNFTLQKFWVFKKKEIVKPIFKIFSFIIKNLHLKYLIIYKMKIKLFISTIFFFILSLSAYPAEIHTFSGVIIDEQSKEPISNATVYLLAFNTGTTTNEKGEFTLVLPVLMQEKNKVKISCVGYKSKLINILNNNELIQIELTPDVQNLNEVLVVKQKYKNKNNPAVELIEKVIANKSKNKKEANDYFETEKYEKVQFAISDITPSFQSKRIFKHFQFLFENIDSLQSNGEKILPMYLKEDLSTYYYQRSPRKVKEIIKAHKVVTIPGVDNKGIEENIKYLYQDVDIYDNNISLVSNRFLSPIANSANVFYRYYIIDTIQSGAEKYSRMYFGPRNKTDLLFQGYLYITTDGTYAVKKVEISVNKDINLNWVNDIKIVQEFERTGNNYMMLTVDQTSINFGINKKSRGLFGQKSVKYSNYQFTPSGTDKKLFDGLKSEEQSEANNRSNQYWKKNRPIELSTSEAGVYSAMDSLVNTDAFKKMKRVATLVLFGYANLGKFEIGPTNTFYSYNPIEGMRFRFGGRTTYEFNNRFSFETYGAYGTTDKRFKYYFGGTWSFVDRDIMQFPSKNLKISYQNETQLPGQQMKFLMEDNILLSIKRGVNDKIFYNKTFKVEHLNEFKNHFSYTLGYRFTNLSPGGNLYFNYTDYNSQLNDVNNLNVSEFYLNLRYAPQERFYQGKTYRRPIVEGFPVFELRFIAGGKAWGNDYNYQNLRLNIRKRLYFSVLGYSDVVWEAGKIFGKVPYPLLNLPQANQSYSYQIESYNMMNFLEFASDQYTSLLVDHTFNGFFFNKIPLVKNLKLRETVTLKVLYGNITKTNDPSQQGDLFRLPVATDGTPITYTLGKTPYIEGSVGVGNIFKFFRVDVVKRFTYLNNPNVSEWGLRMRFRFDF